MKPAELKKLTKAELYKIARDEGLRVTSRMLKAEILEIVEKHFRAAARKKKKDTKEKGVTRKKATRAQTKTSRTEAKAKRKAKEELVRSKALHVESEHLESLEEEVERGKYYLGEEELPVEAVEVPEKYGIDRIVTLVRDPSWIFSYWEITDETIEELKKRLGDNWHDSRFVLRVFDRSSDEGHYFDIELNNGARNWYINVQPERKYQVAIGAIDPDGNFNQIAISNMVETPRGRISDVVDDRWLIPDEVFEKIFAASGGYDMHAASVELRKLIEQRLLEEMGSGAVSSFGSGALQKKQKERGFFLRVATEIILYGATEPGAKVTVQGKEIKLRGDGTFSLRFALPDGKLELPVVATSSDGIEEREIDISVNKKTRTKEPVIK